MILQGYDSSDEENENHSRKKQKIEKPKDEIDVKRLAKQLKQKRKGSDPWSTYSSDEEQVFQPREIEIKSEFQSQSKDEFVPFSEFIGDNESRSYLQSPYKSVTPGSKECFAPKKVSSTVNAHAKGINKLIYFPNSSHLILSCGNDDTIRLWTSDLKPLRIFKGHQSAVKDVVFNSSGDKFLSCGFDKVINLWDTQTGKVLKSLSVNATPKVIKFGQTDEEVLIGLSNSKIEHFDLITLSPLQVYDHHTGSINDLLIHDVGFISTSDDKSIRVWKWQINIPQKVISDPSLFSVPSIKKHPNANYIAIQSMDNTIKVIHSTGKYKWFKKKKFLGHQNAGYGIELNFSPDGKFIMSGDAKGFAYFWDWKSSKQINRIKIDTKLIKCIVQNPQQVNTVICGGASGDIYLLK